MECHPKIRLEKDVRDKRWSQMIHSQTRFSKFRSSSSLSEGSSKSEAYCIEASRLSGKWAPFGRDSIVLGVASLGLVLVNQLGIQLWSMLLGFIRQNAVSSVNPVALIWLASSSITWLAQAVFGIASPGVAADFTARLDVDGRDGEWWNIDWECGIGVWIWGLDVHSTSAMIEPSSVLIFVFVVGAHRPRPFDGSEFICWAVFDGVGKE